jgi:uncharacterized protein YegP (UPF0339 family)
MTQLFVQLTASVTGNVITIVALEIVAAAIGYIIAWFYARSVYTPVIKGLEADKVALDKQVAMLNDQLSNLNEKANNLNQRITKLEGEIAEKDKEIKDLTAEALNVGRYVISKAINDENYFVLKAADGQTILTSQMYSSEAACFNGIESVRTNCSDDSKYERKLSVNNKPYFVLKAANGQVIGNSVMYESEAGMENDIASVKKDGISTSVTEE